MNPPLFLVVIGVPCCLLVSQYFMAKVDGVISLLEELDISPESVEALHLAYLFRAEESSDTGGCY